MRDFLIPTRRKKGSLFFGGINQRLLAVIYRRFEKAYRSHLQGSSISNEFFLACLTLRTGPIGWPETSLTTYPLTIRDVPVERIPHWHIIVITPCACVRIQNAVQNVSISGYVVRQQTHGTSQWRRCYFWFVLQETRFKSLYRDLVSRLLYVLVFLTFWKRVFGWTVSN